MSLDRQEFVSDEILLLAKKWFALLKHESAYPVNVTADTNNLFRHFVNRESDKYDELLAAIELINPVELDLSNIWIVPYINNETAWSPVCEVIETAKPECLRLSNTALMIGCLAFKAERLASAIKNAGVRHLDVSWCQLNNGVGSLFDALKSATISRLDLSYNYLGFASAHDWSKLGELVEMNDVTHLNLAGNFLAIFFSDKYSVDSDAFSEFLKVIKKPSLESLDLSMNELHKLSPESLNELIQALNDSNIRRFYFDNDASKHSNYKIRTHRVSFTYKAGRTHLAFAELFDVVPDVPNSKVELVTGYNEFTKEQLDKIDDVMRRKYVNHLSCKEFFAMMLWRQPGAEIKKGSDDVISFASYHIANRVIPNDVADLLCNESAGMSRKI